MIGERVVLRRVEHFEQRRRRVAAKIRADLVQFVEQNHRVAAFDAAQRLDDASGHRADVSAAMAANLRLVPHAAERDAREFAAERVGHAFAERRFADAGRADEAKNRAFDLFAAFDDGEKFQQAVLDFRQAEMLFVQNFFRRLQINLVLGLFFPRQRRGSNRGNCARRAYSAAAGGICCRRSSSCSAALRASAGRGVCVDFFAERFGFAARWLRLRRVRAGWRASVRAGKNRAASWRWTRRRRSGFWN